MKFAASKIIFLDSFDGAGILSGLIGLTYWIFREWSQTIEPRSFILLLKPKLRILLKNNVSNKFNI